MVENKEKSVIVAGVDGCRGGWLMVRRRIAPKAPKSPESGAESGANWGPEITISASWRELPAADLVAVDMPIGLPASGRRGCDRLARLRLGPRRSSVFLDLRRPLLDFDSYAAANAWAKSDGAGLSKQAWNLLPGIRELDEAMTPADQGRVRETHPELVFAHMAGAPLAAPKRSADGQAARRALLEAAGYDPAALESWLAGLDRGRARPDDLYDACALAWCAARMAEGRAPSACPWRARRSTPGVSGWRFGFSAEAQRLVAPVA